MSWLARSIANSLLLDDDDNDNNNNTQNDAVPYNHSPKSDSINPNPSLSYQPDQADQVDRFDNVELDKDSSNKEDGDEDDDGNQGRGVKEDLSEFTESLTRQFWGVASFLAPPPPPPPPPRVTKHIFPDEVEEKRKEEEEEEEEEEEDGEEEEEEEDSGTCYYYSDNYYYYNVEDEKEEKEVEDAIGVTEEALTFAQNIAHHPETWLDFPFEEEEEEGFQDFQISDSQYKHARAIQRLVPTLAALRFELCPVHMSEGYFWMIYFVLLHSRLNKHDADQLSSAELVQARSMWREELQKKVKPERDWFGRSTAYLQESNLSPYEVFDPELQEDSDTRHLFFNTCNTGSRPYHEPSYNETEKQIVECDDSKSAGTPSGNSERDLRTFQSPQIMEEPDDEDDWLHDTADLVGYSTMGIVVNEEDVSFSDLEEDSDWTLPTESK